MKLFRQIKQNKIKGEIFLHSMPGRNENLDEVIVELKNHDISKIICLAEKSEIQYKSKDYLEAVNNGQLSNIPIIYNPVSDFGIPTGDKALLEYESALKQAYEQLKTENILIHCAGGIGRTGTFSIILLRMIGYSLEEAKRITLVTGSHSEVQEQKDFCRNYIV
jgi:protein-tyrosine phosphatase